MPRLPRAVFSGLPHHITQRGNRRSDVFFSDDDRRTYLDWLCEYCEKHDVDILAYCLMTNHVHLIAVPNSEEGLQQVFKPLHMRYAQRVNRINNWSGHLWQGRFFSSALDDAYLWSAIRYVERNPVRAGLVERAEDYHWSSAAGHCGIRVDAVLRSRDEWESKLASIDNWSEWLFGQDESHLLDTLRHRVEMGLPCGSESFIQGLEQKIGRPLQERPQGRPKQELPPGPKG
ncbi:transposase [Mariprofundus erugo]|uniref:transposase n=1 Tax=Mariprofundus erugo TaxID=2528639 RepID=UPI0010FD3E2C|nr:transposase [Mariprofundus erugo]TLS75590.1 transposase [Mariprofundus erugo]